MTPLRRDDGSTILINRGFVPQDRRDPSSRSEGQIEGSVTIAGLARWSEGRIAELERKVGQQALEIDFLNGCLQRIEEQRMLQALTGNPPSTGRSKKK